MALSMQQVEKLDWEMGKHNLHTQQHIETLSSYVIYTPNDPKVVLDR